MAGSTPEQAPQAAPEQAQDGQAGGGAAAGGSRGGVDLRGMDYDAQVAALAPPPAADGATRDAAAGGAGAAAAAPGTFTMTPAQKLALCESLIVLAAGGGTGDMAVVAAEMMKIPQAGLEALRDMGTRVWVCHGSVTAVRTDLAGVRPRGWPPGQTWDSVPGLFDPTNNRVIIATRGGAVPATGDGHGASNLVIHEVGHAIDHDTSASETPEFVAARTADAATLSAYESQSGEAGAEETYGESMARYHGGDAGDAAAHPSLHAYWATNPLEQQIQQQITEASRVGGDDDYVRDTIQQRHLDRATPLQKAGMIVNLLEGSTGDDDEAMILRILRHGSADATLASLRALGRLDQLFDDVDGEEYEELMRINASEIIRRRAHGGLDSRLGPEHRPPSTTRSA